MCPYEGLQGPTKSVGCVERSIRDSSLRSGQAWEALVVPEPVSGESPRRRQVGRSKARVGELKTPGGSDVQGRARRMPIAEASIPEEPGAGKLHARVCAGAVG